METKLPLLEEETCGYIKTTKELATLVLNTVISLREKHGVGVVYMLDRLQLVMNHINVLQESHNTLFLSQMSIM